MFKFFGFRSAAACFGVFLCLVAAMPAAADENIAIDRIDGDFDAGTLVTIHGQGFGWKDPAPPVLWDDFEFGTVGQRVSTPAIGSYDRISSNISYTETGVYSGCRATYEYFDGSVWENGLVANWIPHEARDSFASMKVKFTSNLGSLAEPSSKLLRLNTWDPDASHGYPNFAAGLRGYSPSLEIVTNLGAGWGDPGQEVVGSVSESSFGDPNGEWFGLSMWVHMGDPGMPNGFAGREFNGNVVEVDNIITLLNGFDTFNGTRSAYFNGHMGLYGSSWLESALDEVYADTTLARVIASDTGGSQFAMQIPYTWSDTTIQIRVNTSAFPLGTPLSLVVYDADNNVSAPFTITVGQPMTCAETTRPGQPGKPTNDDTP